MRMEHIVFHHKEELNMVRLKILEFYVVRHNFPQLVVVFNVESRRWQKV